MGKVIAIAGKKSVLIAAEELAYAQEDKLRYREKLWKGVKFDEVPFVEDIDAPFGLSADLFDDGSAIAALREDAS